MSDPITTVVTVISEHPQAAAAVASIYGVAKPFLAKILGPSADEIGEIGRDYIKGRRAKNAERTLADADKLLAATGREPQEVPLDVAVPLLEAASLQEEPSMAERWAALLANAADPAQSVAITTTYAEILRQLTPAQAKLLDKLFASADETFQATAASYSDDIKPVVRKKDATRRVLHLGDIYHNFIQPPKTNFNEALHQSFDAMLDNLLRQQLIVLANSEPTKTPFSPYNYKPDRSKALLTSLGYDFMLAVTPPTP